MAMSRPEKEQAVAAYKERFEEDEILVIVQNQGLTVAEMTELRLSIRNEGASFKVMKNKEHQVLFQNQLTHTQTQKGNKLWK